MKKFQFTGDWETTIKIDAFAGFQSRQGSYTSMDKQTLSDGTVKINISDDLSDDPDPLPEQIKALNYLLKHQFRIAEVICEKVRKEYPAIMETYCATGYDDEFFPEIKSDNDVKKIIGIGPIHVLMAHKDGVSYLGYECGCQWDDEHGMGIMLHKDRIISFGQADISFSSWEAFKDNGSFEQEHQKWKDANEKKSKVKYYQPHPKYGHLKPMQASENEIYEYRLIENHCNKEFIELVETGKLDINEKKQMNMTFLERAIQFKNEEIVGYILSKKPKDLQNIPKPPTKQNTSIKPGFWNWFKRKKLN